MPSLKTPTMPFVAVPYVEHLKLSRPGTWWTTVEGSGPYDPVVLWKAPCGHTATMDAASVIQAAAHPVLSCARCANPKPTWYAVLQGLPAAANRFQQADLSGLALREDLRWMEPF